MSSPDYPRYSPRWLSAIYKFLDSLPVPFWLLATIYVIALAILRHWIAWDRGLFEQGQINSFLIFNPTFSLALIIAWQYLDRRGELALHEFFANSGKKKNEIDQTVREFLSLSPIPASIFFVFGWFIGYAGFLDAVSVDPQATQVLPVISIVGFALSLGFTTLFIYRLIHQIKMMRQILQRVEADIFNPRKVYALSSYGAAFAASLFIAQTFPSLPLANFFATTGALVSLYGTGLVLLIAFFVPLAEINKRMRANKDRLLAEIGSDLSEIQRRIHLALQKQKYSEVDKMSGSLSTLRAQRELVQKTSTWPWQPETIRNLLTPLLIPLVVFLMQRFLSSWFGL